MSENPFPSIAASELNKDSTIRAWNKRTGEWYWSVFSWPVEGQSVSVFRVDTKRGDSLEDFDCYLVTDVDGNKFRPTHIVTGVTAYYS